MPQFRWFAAVIPFLAVAVAATALAEESIPPSVSEIPAKFTPKTGSFDFVRRDEMVPMRDGVKLRTIVLVPKGARGAPILLARTPYNANERLARAISPLNATETDHSTDTWDTIEWLVRNIPESNGRVATIGGSTRASPS